MSDQKRRAELREVFRQIALTLGKIFAVYDAPDDLVWAVTRSLDQVFELYLGSEETEPSPKRPAPRPRPHPATVELLACIDRSVPGPRGAIGAGRTDTKHE